MYLLTTKQPVSSRAFQMFNPATFNIGSFALPTITTLLGTWEGVPVVMFDIGSVVLCAALPGLV